MIREDPTQHTSTVAEGGSFSNDGRGHGVVSTNPDAHQHSHAEQVPKFVPGRPFQVIRQADDQYNTHYHDDHLFPIDKLPAKGITEESKGQLTNYVADIGSRVDGAAEQERVGGCLDRWFC